LEIKPDEMGSGWYGLNTGGCYLTIGLHDKVKGKAQGPDRILFNFETADVQKEFARIKALGATVIAEPYEAGEGDQKGWIATFADPDGNYFQLMPPWEG
jgi:predicted enzyme related to lactoylglutathione lyase